MAGEISPAFVEVVRVYATTQRDSYCRECQRSVTKFTRVDDGRTTAIDVNALPLASAGFVGSRRVLTFALRDLHALTCSEKKPGER